MTDQRKIFIIDAAREGFTETEIFNLLDSLVPRKSIRSIIADHKADISGGRNNHIINLPISYATYCALYDNGIEFIEDLVSKLDELKNLEGMTEKRIASIVEALASEVYINNAKDEIAKNIEKDTTEPEEVEVIDEYDLVKEFIEMIFDYLKDESFPKESTSNPVHKNDIILYSEDAIFVKVDFIRDVFDRYCSYRKFVLSNGWKPKSWLDTTMSLVSRNLVYYKLIEGKKYCYNRMINTTGNNENYIKIFIEEAELFLNKRCIINCNLEEEDKETNNSASKTCCKVTDIPQIEPEKKDNKNEANLSVRCPKRDIRIDFIKSLGDGRYIGVFTQMIRKFSDDICFDNFLVSGSFNFTNKNDIELLLPDFYDSLTHEDFEALKKQIMELAFN